MKIYLIAFPSAIIFFSRFVDNLDSMRKPQFFLGKMRNFAILSNSFEFLYYESMTLVWN